MPSAASTPSAIIATRSPVPKTAGPVLTGPLSASPTQVNTASTATAAIPHTTRALRGRRVTTGDSTGWLTPSSLPGAPRRPASALPAILHCGPRQTRHHNLIFARSREGEAG
jgi:hypothetical protein